MSVLPEVPDLKKRGKCSVEVLSRWNQLFWIMWKFKAHIQKGRNSSYFVKYRVYYIDHWKFTYKQNKSELDRFSFSLRFWEEEHDLSHLSGRQGKSEGKAEGVSLVRISTAPSQFSPASRSIFTLTLAKTRVLVCIPTEMLKTWWTMEEGLSPIIKSVCWSHMQLELLID